MERKIIGQITFDIEMDVYTKADEYDSEIIKRHSVIYADMNKEILLRRLLFDNSVSTTVKNINFMEVD